MRRYFAIITFLVCLLMLSSSVLAQSVTLFSGSERKIGGKTKVSVSYNKTTDQTLVMLMPLRVWGGASSISGSDQMDMSVLFNYPKQTIATPRAVSLVIYANSISQGTQSARERELIVTADDVRLELGEMSVLHRQQAKAGGAFIFEVLSLPVPYEDWLRIANGKNVKMQVGGRSFTLSGKHLRAFKDFAGLMLQEGQKFTQ